MVKKQVEGAVTAQDLGLSLDADRRSSRTGFSLAVRVLLQNWRQGTVSCLTRAEVNRTGKKPWKQKGTGRARAGTARSPLWRGGGCTFGPQPRVRTLKVSQKLRQGVLADLACERIGNGSVVSLPIQWQGDAPKTAVAVKALKSVGLEQKKVVVLVAPHDFRAYASFVNIPSVRVLFFDQPNVYDLAGADCWVFCESDKQLFKDMVTAWT